MTTADVLRLVVQGMLIGVALAAPIGPINLEIARRALRDGFFSGWLVGLGAVSADTIYAALVVSGMAPLADNAVLRAPLFLAGAVVLCFLGQGGVRGAISGMAISAPPPSGRRSYATGFLMAALNPLGIVYWLSIGAALVASAVAQVGRQGAPLLVGGVFLGIVCWVTFLSAVAQGGRRFVSDNVMRWITGLSGLLLIGFGLYFGVQGIQSIANR